MPNTNWIKETKGFSLIELMVIVAIISLLAAIAIPNYINIRNKPYCSQAETDANNVKSALLDYFSIPSHVNLPDISDLKVVTKNPVVISGDPNATIAITVTDRTGRCPINYRRASSDWDTTESKYTKYMSKE